jgi:hypothetical protein
MTALAVVADPPAMPLSPARAALDQHLAAQAKLRTEIQRVEKPVTELRHRLAAAAADLGAAERDLAGAEAAHSAAIAKAAREGSTAPLPKAPVREELLEHIEEAKRNKAAVERALAECAADLNVATTALRGAEGTVGPLILGVVVEEFELVLQAWRQVHEHFSAVDNNLRGLLDAIGARGRAVCEKTPEEGRAWLAERERMSVLCGKLPSAPVGDFRINSGKWSALLARLATDPAAAV